LNPETPGLWARVLVRALVVAAAAVMALGFLGPGAAVLVAALTALTFVLLWLRARHQRSSRPPGGAPRPPEPRGPRDAG
jgi:membrane protein implicated in regulation of membrane protease activity